MSMNPQLPEQEHLRCPRCHSDNTKFCYYNNYNLSQPRHFCKNCRRYWTKGGTLRNVPVGGAIRKTTKRASSSPISSSTSPAVAPLTPPPDQPKCESARISGGGSFRSQFGSLLMDGLSPNLGDGSGENCLIRNRTADGFESNLFHDNQSRNGGKNGWSPLSMYTPGSSFP